MTNALRAKLARLRAMVGTGVLIRGEPAEEVEDFCELVERYMSQDRPGAESVSPQEECSALARCMAELEAVRDEAARRRILWHLTARYVSFPAACAAEAAAVSVKSAKEKAA